jgi:RNA polymerase sigma-70 factor (ECF subfamily)
MNREEKQSFSDKDLLERFYETGDNHWLGIALQRYTLLLFGVCMKYLKDEEKAKDSVQQIFLKAVSELGKYKVEYFKSWLYMVARNHCLMQFRDKYGNKNTRLYDNITEENLLLNEEKKEKEDWLNAMESSLDELNEEQKNCVILFYLQKKSYSEISSSTGFSLMQVKSHIQNGKRNLKQLIEKKMKQRK